MKAPDNLCSLCLICLLPSLFPSLLLEMGNGLVEKVRRTPLKKQLVLSHSLTRKKRTVVVSLFFPPSLVICVLSFIFLTSLTKYLSISLILSNNQLLVSLIFLFSVSFISVPPLLLPSFCLLWI